MVPVSVASRLMEPCGCVRQRVARRAAAGRDVIPSQAAWLSTRHVRSASRAPAPGALLLACDGEAGTLVGEVAKRDGAAEVKPFALPHGPVERAIPTRSSSTPADEGAAAVESVAIVVGVVAQQARSLRGGYTGSDHFLMRTR
jgi:hypothetical protein